MMDVLQGGLFIFCSKAKTSIKCILWDGLVRSDAFQSSNDVPKRRVSDCKRLLVNYY